MGAMQIMLRSCGDSTMKTQIFRPCSPTLTHKPGRTLIPFELRTVRPTRFVRAQILHHHIKSGKPGRAI